jgi:hypothetical protein
VATVFAGSTGTLISWRPRLPGLTEATAAPLVAALDVPPRSA